MFANGCLKGIRVWGLVLRVQGFRDHNLVKGKRLGLRLCRNRGALLDLENMGIV